LTYIALENSNFDKVVLGVYIFLVWVERYSRTREIAAERDASQLRTISELRARVVELERQLTTPPVSIDFTDVWLTGPRKEQSHVGWLVKLEFTISSSTNPITLQRWNLYFPNDPNLEAPSSYPRFIRMEAGAVIAESMFFHCFTEKEIRGLSWELQFSDGHRSYSIPIPRDLYAAEPARVD
jgi:hypothetical protein